MTTNMRYTMEYGTSPLLSEQRRQDGVKAWTLCRIIRDDLGNLINFEHVAIFNRDHEAEAFQRFLLGDSKIECHADIKELHELQKKKP